MSNISHKGGRRGRKTIRSVKRKRYADNFIRKYGMTRSEWVKFKKTNPQEANSKR
jgi:hypothetical protein